MNPAHVYLMEYEEGGKYILVEDHPMPPTHCLAYFGTFDVPEFGWGEAKKVAIVKAEELKVPIEYHSDFIDSVLAE